MNKITFLVNTVLDNGESILVETTSSNWHKIIEENKHKSKADRRYFYADVICDCDFYDCIIMEVSKDQFDEWSNQERTSRRSRVQKKNYLHLPLELLVSDSSLCIATSTNFESMVLDRIVVEELRRALLAWQPWAVDVLDLYMAGEGNKVSQFLVRKYKIGKSTARRYKSDFKYFVKKFLQEK